MEFVLRIFFSGLITFIPSSDGKELTVVMIDTPHAYEMADGTTLAVGAQSEASAAAGVNGDQGDNAAADAGAVYVFVRRRALWSQQAYVKPLNPQTNDRFGFCVALSADGNIMGACGYDEDGGATGVNGVPDERAAGSGCAYVFVRRGTAWSQEAYVKASNTTPNAAFGSAIVLSGDGSTLAVSAADEDSLSRGIDGDQRSVPTDEGSAGAVYVFAKKGRVWAQQAYVKSSNISPFDLFGIRLALTRDGNVLAAGAPGHPGDGAMSESGAVYVFRRTGAKWSQTAYLRAPNAQEYDQFGSGVAMSAEGRTIAVAASGEDRGARDTGALYVYSER